jgi:hypothetical protein
MKRGIRGLASLIVAFVKSDNVGFQGAMLERANKRSARTR